MYFHCWLGRWLNWIPGAWVTHSITDLFQTAQAQAAPLPLKAQLQEYTTLHNGIAGRTRSNLKTTHHRLYPPNSMLSPGSTILTSHKVMGVSRDKLYNVSKQTNSKGNNKEERLKRADSSCGLFYSCKQKCFVCTNKIRLQAWLICSSLSSVLCPPSSWEAPDSADADTAWCIECPILMNLQRKPTAYPL